MYKIYINGRPVFLIEPQNIDNLGFKADKNNLIAPYTGKKKMFLQYYDLLHKNKYIENVAITHADLPLLWDDFCDLFKVLDAAGGYVMNDKGALLVFFRRGSWDLPKGKIDPGETPEIAAVREVQEETGLVNITLGAFIGHTYHTYEQKDKRILKRTWWYQMYTADTVLIPQTEEDIEDIQWVDPANWPTPGFPVYPNIRELLTLVHP